ncbi:MAG: hypothetical protein H8D49_03830 [Dehalococcoidia bacterium]|nr:hypothetical protein [Dehalococcoidia bacterium]
MISGLQVFRPGVGWLPGESERVILSPGDVLMVGVDVPYRGPAQTFTLYGSIGQRGIFGFDEILVARVALPCPESSDKYTSVAGQVDIEITGAGLAGIGGISPGVNYDLYVKIEEKPEVWAGIDNVIDVAGESGSDLTGMLGMMLPLIMMGMVMPMVTEGIEE